MRNLLYIFSLLPILILASCDTRKDIFENEKNNPVINYVGNSNSSVFSFVKQAQLPFSIDIAVDDIDNVDFTVVNGNGYYSILQSGNNVYNNTVNIGPGSYNLSFDTDSLGESLFTLICTDRYGKVDSLNLTLNVFYNWIPTAIFTVVPQSGGFPFEYTFDSGSSVDQDAAYGGGIIRYIYTIDGMNLNDSLNVPQKTFNYVFPEAGNYNVKHWTMDNDSALSNPYIQSITIN